MLPYKPQELKSKPNLATKLKPIPSLELVQTLNSLCEGSDNTYDTKNHILSINDLAGFETTIFAKFGRSFRSFERQLKMLGFKVRKYQYNDEENVNQENSDLRVYKWKGKKELLIDQELFFIEKGLKERRSDMESARESIRNYKKFLDTQIESIVFSLLVDPRSERAKENLNEIIAKTRSAVNESEVNIKKTINKISLTLGNELELYKLLIYKEVNSEKRVYQKEDEVNENVQSGESEQQQIDEEDEDSKKSIVSIQMDNTVKEEMEQNDMRK